jgi:hypothetical protein
VTPPVSKVPTGHARRSPGRRHRGVSRKHRIMPIPQAAQGESRQSDTEAVGPPTRAPLHIEMS